MANLTKRVGFFAFFAFFVWDIYHSFKQYYEQPLDGDIAAICVPSDAYKAVLLDPFGVQVLGSGEERAAPNRYMAHASFMTYCLNVPVFFQKFTSPLESVCWAMAFLKLGTHLQRNKSM